MPQPSSNTRDGLPAGPAPGTTTAAGSRAASGTGPGVPLNIWPGLPDPGSARDGLPCRGPVTTAAARRVIDAFSLPGDLIAAPPGSPAVTEAAAAAGRRVLALTPGRDPGQLQPGVPAELPPPGDPDAGTAGLAIAGYCGPGCCCGRQPDGPGGDLDPGPVFAACERILRPGGVLAVITSPAAPGGTLTDTAGSIVAAARAAGLVYTQHIVLVRAHIDGDRLVPAGHGPGPAAPAGRAVHDDLVVFTKLGGQARS